MKLLSISLAALTLGAPAGAAEPPADAKKIQGVWRVEHAVKNGNNEPGPAGMAFTFTITADTITVSRPDGTVGTYTLDPTKTPAQIDITVKEKKDSTVTARGIYKLTGDTLVLCVAMDGGERPKAFTSKRGENNALLELKREKK